MGNSKNTATMNAAYISEVQHALIHLQAQAEMTKEGWKDSVAERFYNDYVEHYARVVNLFITGYDGSLFIQGKGLENLLEFVEEKQNEMNHL